MPQKTEMPSWSTTRPRIASRGTSTADPRTSWTRRVSPQSRSRTVTDFPGSTSRTSQMLSHADCCARSQARLAASSSAPRSSRNQFTTGQPSISKPYTDQGEKSCTAAAASVNASAARDHASPKRRLAYRFSLVTTRSSTVCTAAGDTSAAAASDFERQHFLYFLPEPHGQGALRPTFGDLEGGCGAFSTNRCSASYGAVKRTIRPASSVQDSQMGFLSAAARFFPCLMKKAA